MNHKRFQVLSAGIVAALLLAACNSQETLDKTVVPDEGAPVSAPSGKELTPAALASGNEASGATIRQLVVRVDPSVVNYGQMVNLLMDYSIETAGTGSVSVSETRTLLRAGSVLSGFPKTVVALRQNGQQSSDFQQALPARGKEGTYTFRGKVCIGQDCLIRSVRFRVSP